MNPGIQTLAFIASALLSVQAMSQTTNELPVATFHYASSVDGTVPLFADVCYRKDGKPKPVIAVMHGFSGRRDNVAKDIRDLAALGLVAVAPDMRGRGQSAGRFDSGGLDVHDIVDALLVTARKFPAEVDARNINIVGYSGGGGNCFSTFVRFPDLFHVVAPFFGIADYGEWYRLRREAYGKIMDEAIGGPPDKLPLHYLARNSCLGAANNRTARLHIFWDASESACPPVMTERFLETYRAAGHTNAVVHLSKEGDELRWHHGYRTDNPMIEKADEMIANEIALPSPDLSLPPKGRLTVCGYVVTRRFQVFVEGGQRGVVKIEYDLTGREPKVVVTDNPHQLKVDVSFRTPTQSL
jgi:pimeloyl-ACP methyl ester carboxylesterase